MSTLNTVVLVAHVLIGVAIVALVLIQRGKGADAGAAFGAGASGTVFGAQGSANFLSRSTAILAFLFFSTSLGLAYLGAQRTGPESLMNQATTDSAVPVITAPPADTRVTQPDTSAPATSPLPGSSPGKADGSGTAGGDTARLQ
ncbi:MAG: preprotein translocase subunit SecG [Gammaproteobacteria bacterium]